MNGGEGGLSGSALTEALQAMARRQKAVSSKAAEDLPEGEKREVAGRAVPAETAVRARGEDI
jgi:hypothetical protein